MSGARGNKFVSVEMLMAEVYNRFLPIGACFPYAGSTSPNAYFEIPSGQVLSQSAYTELFSVIGNTFNTGGEAVGMFRMPNMAGRGAIGSGTYIDPVSGSVTRTLGQYLGAEKHQLTIPEMPSHTHSQNPHVHQSETYSYISYPGPSSGYIARPEGANWGLYGNTFSATATNNPTGGGLTHNNMQPSLVMNWLMRVR